MKYFFKSLIFIGITLLFVPSIHAQSNYSISTEPMGDDYTIVKIEHQNGRYVEHIVEGTGDDISVGFINQIPKETSDGEAGGDRFVRNIPLPSEEYSSLPLQFFEGSSKMYCVGTKEVLVLDKSTGDVISTIPMSNVSNFNSDAILNYIPVNNFVTGNNTSQKLYVADLSNNLHFINMQTDQVFHTESAAYVDQLSTCVTYNQIDDIVYWLVNSWEGTQGTVLKAFNGTTGALLTQRYFDIQINDIEFVGGYLYITEENSIQQLSAYSLNTSLTFTASRCRSIFKLNDSEFAVDKKVNNMTVNTHLGVFDAVNFIEKQTLGIDPGSNIYYSVIGTSNGRLMDLIGRSKWNIPYAIHYEKDMNGLYLPTNTLELPEIGSFNLKRNSSESSLYFSGKDYMGKIDLQSYTVTNYNNIAGCISQDIAVTEVSSNDVLFSANSKEGTYSLHDQTCRIFNINQTGFKTNTGCYNENLDNLYFLNNRINYNKSGLAVIDGSSSEVLAHVDLGKYLTDVVYNSSTGKVFVGSKGESKVFVVDENTHALIQTINLPDAPTKMISHNNKIYCGSNSAIYVVDAGTYAVTALNLNFTSGVTERCRQLMIHNNKLYGLYNEGNYTYVAQVDLTNNQIDQVYQLSFMNGEEITYDPVNQKIYIASRMVPGFYVYNPANFSLITSVAFYNPTILYNLQMNLDYYKNKVYLTYDVVSGDHYVTVIDCGNYTYNSQAVNSSKSAQLWNPINDQQYFNNMAVNDNNRNELYFDVVDCMDGSQLNDLYSGNLLNKNYLLTDQNDEIVPVQYKTGNKIYWPNGDFSNVSVIDAYTDKLYLQDGWNWVSFPRLERAGNDYVQTEPVLERINYFPCDLYLKDQNDVYKEHYLQSWNGALNWVNSTTGYKLELDLFESPMPYIELHGAKLDPGTSQTIYPNQNNWVAYFLEEGQYPWDAFPENLYNNVLTHIQAQYWAMGKVDDKWLSADNIQPIQYGDMVNVRFSGLAPISFSWNPTDSHKESMRLETEYYSFTEQQDYLPVYVEMDSTSDIQEIAVLADGEVKGASARSISDTLIEVNAYLEGVPQGTPLEIETWAGLKSGQSKKTTYLVKDLTFNTYQKRKIHKGEGSGFYVISLKDEETENTTESLEVMGFECSPNPFTTETNFTFSIDRATNIQLIIYDMKGKQVKTLLKGDYKSGFYKLSWDGTSTSGKELPGGVYFYRLISAEGQLESGKVVLMK